VTAHTYWQHYEDNRYNPVNLYAATKQAFEDILDYYCEAHGFSASAMVLHDTYGPRDYRKKLFSSLSELNEIKIPHEDRYIDFVYVDDVCNALSLAVEDTRNRVGKKRYVISTKEPLSLASAIEIWCGVTGNNITITRNGSLGRDMRYPIDGQWVSGWKPNHTLVQGLIKTYQ
jgi:nucleoside-diphosphate-sugar epimerase